MLVLKIFLGNFTRLLRLERALGNHLIWHVIIYRPGAKTVHLFGEAAPVPYQNLVGLL